MAWSEQCKVSFAVSVVAKTETGRAKSVNEAIKILSKESGIPEKTLWRWWSEQKVLKNEEHAEQAKKTESYGLEDVGDDEGNWPVCKTNGCGNLVALTKRGRPYTIKSKYHGLCGTCRDRVVKGQERRICECCGQTFFITTDKKGEQK